MMWTSPASSSKALLFAETVWVCWRLVVLGFGELTSSTSIRPRTPSAVSFNASGASDESLMRSRIALDLSQIVDLAFSFSSLGRCWGTAKAPGEEGRESTVISPTPVSVEGSMASIGDARSGGAGGIAAGGGRRSPDGEVEDEFVELDLLRPPINAFVRNLSSVFKRCVHKVSQECEGEGQADGRGTSDKTTYSA